MKAETETDYQGKFGGFCAIDTNFRALFVALWRIQLVNLFLLISLDFA